MMTMKRKRVWRIGDRLRHAWWRGLPSGANKADFRADFLEQILEADYLGLEYYWNQYQGVVPLLGTKPSPDPVLKWPECDQNGAIGPLGDNKGRVDTWVQKWDKNGPKKGRKKRLATIWCSKWANSWWWRIYKETPVQPHKPPTAAATFLCFSVFKGKIRRGLCFCSILFGGIKDLHDPYNFFWKSK